MSSPYRVAVLFGSLREQSIDRKLAPAPSARLEREIEAADALLFVGPEYKRSIPGVSKNAIDIASTARRPG